MAVGSLPHGVGVPAGLMYHEGVNAARDGWRVLPTAGLAWEVAMGDVPFDGFGEAGAAAVDRFCDAFSSALINGRMPTVAPAPEGLATESALTVYAHSKNGRAALLEAYSGVGSTSGPEALDGDIMACRALLSGSGDASDWPIQLGRLSEAVAEMKALTGDFPAQAQTAGLLFLSKLDLTARRRPEMHQAVRGFSTKAFNRAMESIGSSGGSEAQEGRAMESFQADFKAGLERFFLVEGFFKGRGPLTVSVAAEICRSQRFEPYPVIMLRWQGDGIGQAEMEAAAFEWMESTAGPLVCLDFEMPFDRQLTAPGARGELARKSRSLVDAAELEGSVSNAKGRGPGPSV